MDELLKDLDLKFKIELNHFLYNKNSYKPIFTELFKCLLTKIKKSEIKINNYVSNLVVKKKQFVTSVENDKGFLIEFIIEKNNVTRLRMSYKETQEKVLDSNYISSKLTQSMYYVYFLKSEYGFKIGKTKNINQRLKTFDVKLPFDVQLYAYIETKRMDDCEMFFHQLLQHRRINGEWFELFEVDFLEIERLSKNWGVLIFKNLPN